MRTIRENAASISPHISDRSLRTSIIYGIITTIYIILSDRLTALFTQDIEHQAILQTIKGLLFILATTSLIYLLLHRDFKVQQQILSDLRSSEAQWRSLVENAPDIVCTVNRQAEVLFINRTPDGSSTRSAVGASVLGYIPPSYHAALLAAINSVFETGQPTPYEIEIHDPRTSPTWFSMRLAPIKHNDHVHAVILVTRDISERKQAEIMLQQALNRVRSIVDASPLAIIHLDPDGTVQSWNAAAERIFGWSADEVIGRVPPYVPPDKMDEFENLRAQVMQGQSFYGFETQRFRKDGTQVEISISTAPIRDSQGCLIGIMTVIDDITERKQAKNALIESEKRYRTLFENMNAGFVLFEVVQNAEGTPVDLIILDANKGFALTTGLSIQEVVGKRLTEVLPGIEHDTADWIGTYGEIALTGEPQQFEQGSELLGVHYSVAAFQAGPKLCAVTFVDITERKQNEAAIQRLNAELEQRVAERTVQLEAKTRELETFNYSVSHDLKAPLRGIDGYGRLLLEDYYDRLDDDGRTFLNNIRFAADQMNRLIDDLLAYSRMERRDLSIVPVNPQTIVQSLVAEFASETQVRGLSLDVKMLPRVVSADPEGLKIVLRNLIDNALKFTRDTAAPMIEIGGYETETSCILWVRDNGIGFDMQYHDRIFEIFQRLHRVEDYAGTGIGLAIVRKTIERMKGRVWAESEPGHGATFFLEIPK